MIYKLSRHEKIPFVLDINIITKWRIKEQIKLKNDHDFRLNSNSQRWNPCLWCHAEADIIRFSEKHRKKIHRTELRNVIIQGIQCMKCPTLLKCRIILLTHLQKLGISINIKFGTGTIQ